MTSWSGMCGSSVRCFEKRRAYSRRVSPDFLLAFAEVPRVAWPYVGPFEITLEHPDHIDPIVDLVGRELLEPSAGSVGKEERQLSDDGSIVSSSATQLTG